MYLLYSFIIYIYIYLFIYIFLLIYLIICLPMFFVQVSMPQESKDIAILHAEKKMEGKMILQSIQF